MITVGELIKKLTEVSEDLPVMIEGCDCHGWADGVEMSEGLLLVGKENVKNVETALITRGEDDQYADDTETS